MKFTTAESEVEGLEPASPASVADEPAPGEDDPAFSHLSYRERSLCKNLRLAPSTFIRAASQLEDESKRRGGLKESEATALTSWHSWETGQWSGFWAFVLRFGYVWIRRSRKRGRRAEESSDEESALVRVRPFHREISPGGTVQNRYGELPDVEMTFDSDGEERVVNRRPAGRTGPAPRRSRHANGLEPPKRVQTSDNDDLVVEMPDRSMYRWVLAFAFSFQTRLTRFPFSLGLPAAIAAKKYSPTSKATSTTSAFPTDDTFPLTRKPFPLSEPPLRPKKRATNGYGRRSTANRSWQTGTTRFGSMPGDSRGLLHRLRRGRVSGSRRRNGRNGMLRPRGCLRGRGRMVSRSRGCRFGSRSSFPYSFWLIGASKQHGLPHLWPARHDDDARIPQTRRDPRDHHFGGPSHRNLRNSDRPTSARVEIKRAFGSKAGQQSETAAAAATVAHCGSGLGLSCFGSDY